MSESRRQGRKKRGVVSGTGAPSARWLAGALTAGTVILAVIVGLVMAGRGAGGTPGRVAVGVVLLATIALAAAAQRARGAGRARADRVE